MNNVKIKQQLLTKRSTGAAEKNDGFMLLRQSYTQTNTPSLAFILRRLHCSAIPALTARWQCGFSFASIQILKHYLFPWTERAEIGICREFKKKKKARAYLRQSNEANKVYFTWAGVDKYIAENYYYSPKHQM